jgi:hypothetical protein
VVERWGAHGVGVDLSREFLDAARERCAGLELYLADVAEWPPEPDSYDLVISVGGPIGLGRLAALVRPRGLVLLGEGYWRSEPSPDYLASLGASADELTDHAGNLAAGRALGLTPLRSWTASDEDWDRYETAWAANGERWADANPGDDADELLRWIHAGRDRYLRLGGRDTLGFGLYLFRA